MGIKKQQKKQKTVLLYGLCIVLLCLCGYVSRPDYAEAKGKLTADKTEYTDNDATAIGTATVMTPLLNVKREPKQKSATSGALAGGRVVDLIEVTKNGKWALIKADGLSGYVKTEDIEILYNDTFIWDADSFINVKLYGAKGDGITEDTKAICKAFEAAKESGNPLYFPEGEYLLEWGKVVVELNEKGMRIVGDGKYNSVIKMKEDHNHCNYGNGIILYNREKPKIKPNVFVKDIGITYDNNDSTLVFTKQSRLLGLYGYLGKVCVENCYFHIGGTVDNMPEDTCIFVQLGAELISIKNCILENFTNRQLGGGIWIMPDWLDSNNQYVRGEIKRSIVQGNILRTTNSDEAITLYPSYANDSPGPCFKDVLISDNVITHKSWREGTECSPTHGLLTVFVYNKDAPVVDSNIIVSNNTLQSEIAYMEPIRIVGFTGVHVLGNKVTVEKTTQTDWLRILLFGRDTKGVVRDNTFDYSSLTAIDSILLLSDAAEGAWEGNTIKTGGNFILSPGGHSTVLFKNNTVVPLNGGKFTIQKNGFDAKVLVSNNIVYGETKLDHLYGSDFIVKGNSFNAGSETDNDCLVLNQNGNGSLDYQKNNGVTLVINDTSVTTQMESFTYKGKRSNLKFYIRGVEVPDSEKVRATFFISSDIQYTD